MSLPKSPTPAISTFFEFNVDFLFLEIIGDNFSSLAI
ncbi:hypothetical protein SAMD00023520_02165 [Listeria monocytogenes]|nr:hypothetical protein SAMD00023520_02165 [Listeria monocytogenes]